MNLHAHRRAYAALVVGLFALGASGCGKSSSKDTTPATSAVSEVAPATEGAATVETAALSSEAAAAVTEGAAGAAGESTTAAPADVKLINAGKVTVCSDIPYAPFEYYENGADGKVIGIDAEIVGAITADLGLTADFIKTPFDGIFAALAAGKCDIIASSVSITDERKQQNDFTDGYFKIHQTILARTADASKFVDLASLKGKTVGAQSATTGADFANAGSAANGYSVKEFQGADELLTALKAGTIDVVIQDSPINGYAATQSKGDLVVTKVFDGPTDGKGEEYGFVVPKANPGLTAAMNASLKKLQSAGTYKTILTKYLGTAVS